MIERLLNVQEAIVWELIAGCTGDDEQCQKVISRMCGTSEHRIAELAHSAALKIREEFQRHEPVAEDVVSEGQL